MTILTAGQIGRFDPSSNIENEDDFLLLKDGTLLRVTASDVASYVVSENTTVRTITSSDSPYTVVNDDEIIVCDCSGGSIIVNLQPVSTALRKKYTVIKIDSSANTATITPSGSELINLESERIITAQLVAWTFITDGSQWIVIA